jgi:predicted DNA-binding transcriptional regulator AlpA
MSLDPYLTAKEVGSLLRVSEKTVHRWASDDPTMPVVRLGGGKGERAQLRFPESRLAAWLRAHEQGIGKPRASKLVPSESAAPGQVLDLASVRDGETIAGRRPKRAMGQSVGQEAARKRVDGQ